MSIKINKSLIPKGTDKKSQAERRGIITAFLSQYKGKKIFCPCLNKNIEFNYLSVRETAFHACNKYESVLLVLNIEKAIKYAYKPKNCVSLPDKEAQTKGKFKTMYALKGKLNKIGYYKLMVGEKQSKKILHYCITHKKANN